MAAADPSPAAVITCARGFATLPATQTPATLVRPVRVYDRPAVVVEVAAELDEQVIVRNKARRHEQRIELDDPLVVELDAEQLIILDRRPVRRPRQRRRPNELPVLRVRSRSGLRPEAKYTTSSDH